MSCFVGRGRGRYKKKKRVEYWESYHYYFHGKGSWYLNQLYSMAWLTRQAGRIRNWSLYCHLSLIFILCQQLSKAWKLVGCNFRQANQVMQWVAQVCKVRSVVTQYFTVSYEKVGMLVSPKRKMWTQKWVKF